jgi:hypothetical protein
LEAIGRTDAPVVNDPDAEPFVVPIIGYGVAKDAKGKVKRDEDGEPIPEERMIEPRFVAMSPTGITIRSMRLVDSIERMPTSTRTEEIQRNLRAAREMLAFLDLVVHDDDRQMLDDFVGGKDVEVTFETIGELYRSLTAAYAGRPTLQRSVSHNGRVTRATTSRAAARSRASTSTRSRSKSG